MRAVGLELADPDPAPRSRPLGSVDATDAEAASTPGHNLPVHLTSFVGRQAELVAVERLLTDERLVTLTGPGGCGKTRLAVEAAALRSPQARPADGRPGEVWWIDLSPVTDSDFVIPTIAATMGLLLDLGTPLRALGTQLRDRRTLVCLDNCEHVLDAAAEVAEALLRTCPHLSVLATSREPLDVPGEVVWRVPPLADDEAVALFTDRARRLRPQLTLDGTNEVAVRAVCRRLDGIPLAVELAAAWSRTLTPGQIVAGLDDRFALLVRGPRHVTARQQTLVASIDWSHDLLDEADRVVFRRLAVFAGGFSLDAARTVCGHIDVGPDQVLAALGRLVDKSLVVVDEHAGEARYRLLETIREYARDRLDAAGETASARDRHLDHFLAFAEAAEAHLESADQDAYLALLATEHDNLRLALDWGISADQPQRGRRLAAALVWMWRLHGHSREGTEVLQRAIERAPDDRSTLQARLLTGVAWVANAVGPREIEAAQRGLDIATANGDHRIRGRCLLLSAFVHFYRDFDAAWDLSAQAEQCATASDDRFVADSALVLQGVISCYRDRHGQARQLLDQGFERCLRRGDRGRAVWALGYLQDSAARTGELRRADELASRAVAMAAPLGDYFTVGFATSHLALVKGMAGDIDAGQRLIETLLRPLADADDPYDVQVPNVALVMGKLSLWVGDPTGAVGWFRRDVGMSDPPADSLAAACALPGLGAALRHLSHHDEAQAHLDRAVALAHQFDVPHLLAEALDQLAHLVAGDDPARAEDLHHQALGVRVDHGLHTFYVDSLDALAHLALRAESYAEAARLLAASDAARDAMGYPRPPIDQPAHDEARTALRAALGGDALATAWDGGARLSLDDAVSYARRARGTRARPSTGWASLTPTELDVVRLVAEGLTNPEIGSRLFISRATVKTHLSHVYAKLGVANRTELATLASTQAADS
jgi:predicted ATPase/DNA-binding CsgD family transcriptional regulator